MSVDKAFLRNVCLQTEVGREELKALKARTGSSPAFMEQHVLLLQDPDVQVMQGPAVSNIPVLPASRGLDLWRTLSSSRREDAGVKGKQKKENSKGGWLVLNIGITECITPARAAYMDAMEA